MLDRINGRNVDLFIFQFGCGGVGSWLAHFMGKFLHSISERYDVYTNLRIDYTIIDDDIVEERNILRQNFFKFNIGDYKCNAIFKLINTSLIQNKLTFIRKRIQTPKKVYEILTRAIDDISVTFTSIQEKIWIILGCVDNIKTRRSIYSAIKKFIKQQNYSTIIYIDGGNEIQHGQVITTFMTNSSWFPTVIRNWDLLDKPLNIHKLFPPNSENVQPQQTCAFFGDQSMGINLKVATEMFANVQRILIDSIIPTPLIKHLIL